MSTLPKKKNFTFRISERRKNKLIQVAEERDCTATRLLEECIDKFKVKDEEMIMTSLPPQKNVATSFCIEKAKFAHFIQVENVSENAPLALFQFWHESADRESAEPDFRKELSLPDSAQITSWGGFVDQFVLQD